jgi:hypothetical protein
VGRAQVAGGRLGPGEAGEDVADRSEGVERQEALAEGASPKRSRGESVRMSSSGYCWTWIPALSMRKKPPPPGAEARPVVRNWVLDDREETASILKPGADPRGGRTGQDLTELGKPVRDRPLQRAAARP